MWQNQHTPSNSWNILPAINSGSGPWSQKHTLALQRALGTKQNQLDVGWINSCSTVFLHHVSKSVVWSCLMCFPSKKCPPAHPLRVLRARLEKVWRFAGLHLKNQEDPSWVSTSISHPTNTLLVKQLEEIHSSTHSTRHSVTLNIGSTQSLPIFFISASLLCNIECIIQCIHCISLY